MKMSCRGTTKRNNDININSNNNNSTGKTPQLDLNVFLNIVPIKKFIPI